MSAPIATHLDQFGQVVHECPVCGEGFYVAFVDPPASAASVRDALDFHARRLHRIRWLLDRLDLWALNLPCRAAAAVVSTELPE